jgi:hypothetical protein
MKRMNKDPELVRQISERTGFPEYTVDRALAMLRILKMVAEDPTLGKCFALIGGTAINLFDAKIPRLSVDIDLDYIHKDKFRFGKNIMKEHLAFLRRIEKFFGIELHSTGDTDINRLGASFFYKSDFASEGVVKLDIRYLMKTTIFPPVHKRAPCLHPGDGLERFRILTAHPCELWAGKALALIYKAVNDPKPKEAADLYSMFIARHLFDVYRIQEEHESKKQELTWKRIRTAFILKGVARVQDLYDLTGEAMRRCSQNEIERELYPYLRADDRPALREITRKARKFINHVISGSWCRREELFVKRFQEEGGYHPEILFGKYNRQFKHLYRNDYLKEAAKNMGGSDSSRS